jgi:hypothetical protein
MNKKPQIQEKSATHSTKIRHPHHQIRHPTAPNPTPKAPNPPPKSTKSATQTTRKCYTQLAYTLTEVVDG